MKLQIWASYAFLCALAVSTSCFAADSSDLADDIAVMGPGGSGAFEAVAGWSVRTTVSKGPRKCVQLQYGQTCFKPDKLTTEQTHQFGTLTTVTKQILTDLGEYGMKAYTIVVDACPAQTSKLLFEDGYTRSNGTVLPGPAYVCGKF